MTETPAVRTGFNCDREGRGQNQRVAENEDHRLDAININGAGYSLQFGTWNVRTLYQAGKFQNCIQEMEDHKLDILGLAEVRWTDSGKAVKEGNVLYYSGGVKNEYGVGIVVSKKHARSVMGYWPISDRVIVCKLQGKPFNIVVIQVYAPTSQHSDNEVEKFYADVESGIKQAKKEDIIITMGDLNAKVGKGSSGEVVGEYGYGSRNDRGDRLVQFCQENDMWVGNTFFQKQNRRLYTWKSPGDIRRNQIDYIMCNKRYKNGIKDVQTYPGADINSDHCLLVAKTKFKLKKVKKGSVIEQYDLSMLKEENIRCQYALEVKNRYAALNDEEIPQTEEEAIEKKWNNFKSSVIEATKVIPKKEKKKDKDWMTEEIKDLMKKRKEEKAQHGEKSDRYEQINLEIVSKCREAKEVWFNSLCDEIGELERNHKSKEMHRKVKSMTGKNKKAEDSGCIKDENGNMLFEKEDVEKRWTQYIRDLYDDPDREELEDIPTGSGPDILKEEVKFALKVMGSNKAPGIDGITAEHLRALDEESVEVLTDLCNMIYKKGYMPADLMHSVFIKIAKKPKAVDCTDFRTISLMSHVIKIILKIIIERNTQRLEEIVSDTQSGFRIKIGTREGIFNARSLVEATLEINGKLYVCFIDYKKAFDRVFHHKLMKVVEKHGLDENDRRILQNLYYKQTASVQFGQEQSESFPIKRGVRQGCVLSPKLFNIYTEEIFGKNENMKGVRIGGISINDLRFADDTLLVAESEEELQELVSQVEENSLEYGLEMNVKKTKTMVIRRNDKEDCNIKIRAGGKVLEQVKQYVYLGHLITEEGRCDKEIRRRIEIARAAFIKMKSILTSRKIKIETRKRLIRCYILSTFLYASETWTIHKDSWNKIEAFEMWLLRKMMKIPYTAHKSNLEVLKMTNSTRMLKTEITKRKIQYFGHLVRKGGLQRILLEGKMEGRRGRGRPRRAWFSDISEATGLSYTQCVRMVQRRQQLQIRAVDGLDVQATTR